MILKPENFRNKITVAIILALIITPTVLVDSQPEFEIAYEFSMSVRVINAGDEAYHFTEEDKTWLYSFNTSWQVLRLVHSTFPVLEKKLDEDNNTVVILGFPEVLEPGAEVSLKLIYHGHLQTAELPELSLEESGEMKDIPLSLKEKYCTASGPWLLDEWPDISDKARDISGNDTNVLSVLLKLVRWIRSNVEYVSGLPRYPNETYGSLKGDCDDQASLLIAFCRALGIPAYLQTGCMYLVDRKSHYSYFDDHISVEEIGLGFHGWAVVYVPPWGWIPVDLTWGELGKPETAITQSAVTSLTTLTLSNIVHTDYIQEIEELFDCLSMYDLYLEETYSMRVLRSSVKVEQNPLMLAVSVGTLVAMSSALTYLYVVFRREPSR